MNRKDLHDALLKDAEYMTEDSRLFVRSSVEAWEALPPEERRVPDLSRKETRMTPTRKVTAATLGAAVATIALALIPGTESVELQGAVTTVAVFICGWIVSEG